MGTTTVDIILGLLEPQKGTLEISNKITKHNLRSWQKSIVMFLSKSFFLTTQLPLILFWVRPKDIKFDAVEKAHSANLHQFIMDELPNNTKLLLENVV